MHIYSEIANIKLNIPDTNIYYLLVTVGLKDFQTLGRDGDSESVDFEFSLQCGHAMEVWVPVWGERSMLNTWFYFSCT